jgi:prepilin-type N-terminal cleavage/methylation domain-containing protein
MFSRRRPRRSGFTLVELLTVIGIISLLIGILLPSLSRARAQAKRLKVSAQIDAIGKGLEMFRNDFDQYPDSRYGEDGIDWEGNLTGTVDTDYLSGAHWLARAMAGHDFQGVDAKGLVLQRKHTLTVQPKVADLRLDTTPPGRFSERKGTYLDAPVFAKDNDATKFPNPMPNPTGRPVIIDGYGFPVLYYRANPRARYAFSLTGTGANAPNGSADDAPGVYNLSDNAMITGGRARANDGTSAQTSTGWDFTGTGLLHGISEFGTLNVQNIDTETVPNTHKGKTFTNFFHNESAHEAAGTVRPYNPETFILLSAGADGIFGTEDDVSNFKPGDQ